MSISTKTFINKRVSIGLDVHKKKYAVAAICEGVVEKKWTMDTDPDLLIAQLKKFFVGAQINCVYEAGFSGFSLHWRVIRP